MVEAEWSWVLEQKIPSSLEIAHEMIEQLLSALTDAGWDGRDYFHVQMAIEEALVNAVRHGNCESPDKIVELEFKVAQDTVFLRIQDEGDGFDPTSLPDPRDDDNLDQTNGRGVMLINEMMNEVKYNSVGNEIKMIKYRSS